MNAVFLTAVLILSAPHTPSASVVGNTLTIDADFAIVGDRAVPDAQLTQGVILVGPASMLAASSDGVSPMVWTLPPGTYTVTMYGFPPDRKNPMRVKAIQSVTMLPPTRVQQLRTIFTRLDLSLAELSSAKNALTDLVPTRDEIIEALAPAGSP